MRWTGRRRSFSMRMARRAVFCLRSDEQPDHDAGRVGRELLPVRSAQPSRPARRSGESCDVLCVRSGVECTARLPVSRHERQRVLWLRQRQPHVAQANLVTAVRATHCYYAYDSFGNLLIAEDVFRQCDHATAPVTYAERVTGADYRKSDNAGGVVYVLSRDAGGRITQECETAPMVFTILTTVRATGCCPGTYYGCKPGAKRCMRSIMATTPRATG